MYISEQKLMRWWTHRREYLWRQSQQKLMKGDYQQEWPVSILYFIYCKFGNFREVYIFTKLRICEVSWKIKSSRNVEITLSFTDIGKSCSSGEFLVPQICLLTLFANIKFSRKFPDLEYEPCTTSKAVLLLWNLIVICVSYFSLSHCLVDSL